MNVSDMLRISCDHTRFTRTRYKFKELEEQFFLLLWKRFLLKTEFIKIRDLKKVILG